MTVEFDNLEFTTDKNKATPKLDHDFCPLSEDPSVVVKCEYFKSGELIQYMDLSTKGKVNYRFRDIFADKVLHITGIEFKDKKTGKVMPIEDAKTFLSLPSVPVFDQILMAVAGHLIAGDSLTEEEEKN